MCLCHIYYRNADSSITFNQLDKSLPVNMIANQLPASTKENPSFHGYGLQNVHTTLEKYHTLYAMDYENGWFEFATELPNTLIS